MNAYSMNHTVLTMKDADGREMTIPFDRGDFAIGKVECGPVRRYDGRHCKDGPVFGYEPVIHTLHDIQIKTRNAVRDVVVSVHRGRWLMRECTTVGTTFDGDNVTINWQARRAPEFRRKAPARLRRLTAQRRMQAERKAERRRRAFTERIDAAWGAVVAKVGPDAAQAAIHPEEVFRVRPRLADGEIA